MITIVFLIITINSVCCFLNVKHFLNFISQCQTVMDLLRILYLSSQSYYTGVSDATGHGFVCLNLACRSVKTSLLQDGQVRENIPLKPNGQEILLQKSMNWSQYRVINPQRSLWITNRYVILSDTHTNKTVTCFELILLKPVHSIAELHNALSKINKWINKQMSLWMVWLAAYGAATLG